MSGPLAFVTDYLCDAFNGDGFQDYWSFGTVHAVTADLANFFDDIVAFHDFAKDGVLAGEPAGVGCGDEKLATVSVGTDRKSVV